MRTSCHGIGMSRGGILAEFSVSLERHLFTGYSSLLKRACFLNVKSKYVSIGGMSVECLELVKLGFLTK